MTYDFTLTATFAAPAAAIYDAWMDSAGHTAMTQGIAVIDPVIGGAYTAHDGYISGVTLELEPHRRIRQTWRTMEFPSDHADSEIEVVLTESDGVTTLTLHHRGVPDDQRSYEESGWQQFYFEPMARRMPRLGG